MTNNADDDVEGGNGLDHNPPVLLDKKKETYEVGYGKPPISTRFKKGHSGNPRGRRPKPKPRSIYYFDAVSDSLMEKEIYRPVKIHENGKVIEMPSIQAAMRAMTTDAIKGKRLSQQYLIELASRKETESRDFWIKYYCELEQQKKRGEAILADCKRKNIKPPELAPHPHDIKLNPVTLEADVHGPRNLDELQSLKYFMRLRDFVFRLTVRAVGIKGLASVKDGQSCAHGLYFLGELLDRSFYERYKWAIWQMSGLASTALSLSKREWKAWSREEWKWLEDNKPFSPASYSEDFFKFEESWTRVCPHLRFDAA